MISSSRILSIVGVVVFVGGVSGGSVGGVFVGGSNRGGADCGCRPTSSSVSSGGGDLVRWMVEEDDNQGRCLR